MIMLLAILVSVGPSCSFVAGLELPGSRDAARALLLQAVNSAPGKDPYATMTWKQKTAWAWDAGRSMNETLGAISAVPVDLVVEVRLVGLQGDGHSKLNVPPLLLLKYLAALPAELDTVALRPELRRLLPLVPRVTFKVTSAQQALHEAVGTALAVGLSLAREGTSAPAMLVVPYGDVDKPVRADWELRQLSQAASAAPTFTLYLLNPSASGAQPYGYDYDPVLPGAPRRYGEAREGRSSCVGSIWTAAQPYAWVDITAGPFAYGPGINHQGQVLGHSLPRPGLYRSDAASSAIVPDLAALAWSACKHLVWPPLHTTELEYHEEVVVQVIHMHDAPSPPKRNLNAPLLLERLRAAVPGVVEVKEAWLSFAQCDLCSAAFVASSQQRTSVDLSHEGGAITRPLLDSQRLHSLMQRFRDRILARADVLPTASGQNARHTLPVFIFDITQVPLMLLDDATRSVAFPDMVLAVATENAEPLLTHFACANRRMMIDGGDITREVLADVLQSGWGVAHTAAYHSRTTGENANYLWAVGNTAFGPLSRLTSLSATQTQAAARSHVAVMVDGTSRRVAAVMQAFMKLCPESVPWRTHCALDSVLQGKLRQRLNIYLFKVNTIAQRLADWDARGAIALARSAQHDALALEILAAYGTLGHVDAMFKCEGHTEMWHFFVYPALSMFAWLAAVMLRLKVSKPKQYKQY